MGQKLGEDAVLTALKSHAKIRRADINPTSLAQAVNRETDRGAVIIVSSLVEDVLLEKMETLFRALTAKEKKELVGPDRPLGSFANRIQMAYALKLIDRETAKICNLLRAMRNACAHSLKPLSFEDDVLKNALRLILERMERNPPRLIDSATCKANLVVVTFFLLRTIDTGSRLKAADHTIEILEKMRDEFGIMATRK